MKHHNYSFFGQKTGLLLDSAEIDQPCLYLRFLKKKPDGSWEKPSLGQGKNIKLNLLEMIAILRIFRTQNTKWSTVHKFGEDTTSITVENKNTIISFMISGYAKQLKFPESNLFTDLLDHIYHEKIIHATGSKMPSKNGSNKESTSQPSQQNISRENEIQDLSNSPIPEYPEELDETPQEKKIEIDPEQWYNSLRTNEEFKLLPGAINEERAKAINFHIADLISIWVPNSCIDQEQSLSKEGIWVKDWFLRKKMVDIFAEMG
uniref:Uncharacterized protein n=1 Tax=Promethearchaeum syntrophicum TaxID=2594042 RepID=A0A5B9DG85_9ARCH|nr:hypothetical protein [Candidatus Prometheoarchaeum syntrophicum]QEE17756.1 hypothetical protein DSAG12_03594 [Candidatus Prometheoarchaeum syntrophicum]